MLCFFLSTVKERFLTIVKFVSCPLVLSFNTMVY